ncbi:hypothetical protein CsSME_00043142 [Camellia sinensis var. sinensis]
MGSFWTHLTSPNCCDLSCCDLTCCGWLQLLICVLSSSSCDLSGCGLKGLVREPSLCLEARVSGSCRFLARRYVAGRLLVCAFDDAVGLAVGVGCRCIWSHNWV